MISERVSLVLEIIDANGGKISSEKLNEELRQQGLYHVGNYIQTAKEDGFIYHKNGYWFLR